ncbi:TPA: hypothetical protein U2D50_001397 [Streptococcus suis]|nr:hypothetical protein [Streptococcus suis]HEM6419309.1 hypothetical protein [Streptococcus suis]HEM6425508.1 hypothetical protein [Streptococcus suis]
MENYLMYGIVILGIVGAVLNIALILVYAIAIRHLDDQQREYKNEMRRIFGWDEYGWSENFNRVKERSERLLEEVDELNKLPLIIQAKKEQALRRLNHAQDKTQREIERLSK